MEKIEAVRQIVLGDFEPDLTIILDVEIELGLKRACAVGGKNRYEDMNFDFHTRVKNGFDYVFKNNQKRCLRLDATNPSIDVLFERIVDETVKFFS
jgi:dTMP kinase